MARTTRTESDDSDSRGVPEVSRVVGDVAGTDGFVVDEGEAVLRNVEGALPCVTVAGSACAFDEAVELQDHAATSATKIEITRLAELPRPAECRIVPPSRRCAAVIRR